VVCDFVPGKNYIVFFFFLQLKWKLSIYIKTCLNQDKFEKIDVAPTHFFSDKIKRKKLIALEFACITNEIKLIL